MEQDVTKVPKEYLVLGGGLVFALLVFLGIGAGSLCNIIGFLYPAFKSFEAIETKQKGDDTQWLIYWVVYAFFSIIEVFVDFLIYWIPFYYAFKLAFLLRKVREKSCRAAPASRAPPSSPEPAPVFECDRCHRPAI